MTEIRINPKFQGMLPCLTAEELAALEESLIAEGCRDPLVVWRGEILDGHNRYAICTRRAIPFRVIEIDLPDEEAAMDWIDRNQLARRNLTPEAFRLALGRRYIRARKQGARTDLTSDQIDQKLTTAEKIGAEHGVSSATVRRAGKFAEEVERDPEMQEAIHNNVSTKKVKRERKRKAAEEAPSPEPPQPPTFTVYPGDIWQLGANRIMCGDAYNQDHVASLLGSDAPTVLLADPPYGIDYNPDWSATNIVASGLPAVTGDRQPFDPVPFLGYPTVMLFGANYFSDRLPLGGWLCWDKRLTVDADAMFGSPFELAWYRARRTTKKAIMVRVQHGGAVNADGANQPRLVATQKPIALMDQALEVLATDSDLVYDPFCGSGPVLMACEARRLRCLSMDIEPECIAIAIGRWAAQTGNDPVLLSRR